VRSEQTVSVFDIVMTDKLLTTTRAVRRRLDLERPVEPEVVLDCLRVAVQAPTASNQQDWRWMVVTDATKGKALADLYNDFGAAYLSQARFNQDDAQTARVYESAFALTEFLAQGAGVRDSLRHPPDRQRAERLGRRCLRVDHCGRVEFHVGPALARRVPLLPTSPTGTPGATRRRSG
jgi:nitroreductase